jgi:transposase
MDDLFLQSERQMARISPFFPLAHGVPRVDDRRVVSGIVYVIRNGLQWKDAPKGYGPRKTLSAEHYAGNLPETLARVSPASAPVLRRRVGR